MKFRIYVWVDGAEFEPESFNDGLGVELKGDVLSRKRVVDGNTEDAGRYWRSKVIEDPSGCPEESLGMLLAAMRPFLQRIRDLPSIRITAELVAECEESDALRGYFFSADVIQILAAVGASLDIDVVRLLK